MYIRNSVGIINLEYNNNGVYQNNDHSVQRKKKPNYTQDLNSSANSLLEKYII